MEAKPVRRRWSYSEFARLPSDGGVRHEVIDGKVAMTPAPALHHQRIVTRIVGALLEVTHRGLGEVFAGPVDVLFAEGDYLEPDVLYVRSDRSEILSERGVEGAPDLVVEVTSPATANRDRGIKRQRYERYGVPEYWIVDPDARTIERWRFATGAEPRVYGPGDTLRWSPVEGTEPVTLDVEGILSD